MPTFLKRGVMTNDEIIELYKTTGSISEVSKQLGVGKWETRKILVDIGVYQSKLSEKIQALREEGYSAEEIANILKKGRSCVFMYLPYEKCKYNSGNPSENAKRIRKCREKKREKL